MRRTLYEERNSGIWIKIAIESVTKLKDTYAIFILLPVFLLSFYGCVQTETTNAAAAPAIKAGGNISIIEQQLNDIAEKFPEIIYHEVNPRLGKLQFYSTDENGVYFQNHKHLKEWLIKKNQQLVFAMNGGMYKKDLSPQGLYIEAGIENSTIDKRENGYGNFYLQPNGIFCILSNNEPKIMITKAYKETEQIKYATQSGPMLLIGGKIHPKFNQASKNLHIRNGAGILPNGNVLFAMSKEKVNFYRLAEFFKAHQCKNALYLDGFVSRTYLPSKNWVQEDGRYGIIIAEIE